LTGGSTEIVICAVAQARLVEVRRLRELQPVLYDREFLERADPSLQLYEIYRDCCDEKARDLMQKHDLRYDVTVMPPLLLGEEYGKTRGHYHMPPDQSGLHAEVFEIIEGEACFLLQTQHSHDVVNVSLVRATKGEKVLIHPNQGHVMINPSAKHLVTGNLISGSCMQYSDQYLERRGGAYYVLTGGRYERNRNYSSVPEIRVLRNENPGFLEGSSGLVEIFLKDPSRFAFLNDFDARWKENVAGGAGWW